MTTLKQADLDFSRSFDKKLTDLIKNEIEIWDGVADPMNMIIGVIATLEKNKQDLVVMIDNQEQIKAMMLGGKDFDEVSSFITAESRRTIKSPFSQGD